MELRPLLITRMANMVPGSVLMGLGVACWFEAPGDAYLVGAAVLAVVGAVLAFRGYRLGARYDGDTLTVRGMFRSRRIHRTRIRDITEFPAVRWSSRSGRTVWTPIIAFAELDKVIPPVARRNEQAIAQLRRWHRKRRG